MRLEVPELRRCCLCLPLRRGLLAWAYINLICQILFLVNVIRMVIQYSNYMDYSVIAIEACNMTLITATALYTILVIVSCHKKNSNLLRITYKCGVIIWFALDILFLVSLCYNIKLLTSISDWGIQDENYQMILRLIIGHMVFDLLLICFNGYIILLIRSEMLKLEEQSLEIKFVNNAAECQARCVVRTRDTAISRYNTDNE